MTDEGFDFDKLDKEFNVQNIEMVEIAKVIVPMFLAYRKEGLTAFEAAALTAAFIATPVNIPRENQGEE